MDNNKNVKTKLIQLISEFNISQFLIYAIIFGIVFSILLPFNPNLRWRHYTMPSYSMSDEIAVVAIDDKTISNFQQWPLDKNNLSVIIDSILQQKPKKLGVDLLIQDTNDQASKQLNTLLTDSNVIVAQSRLPSPASETTSTRPQFASASLPLSSDGKIYLVPTYQDQEPTLVSSMIDLPSSTPKEFLINPKTNLPPTYSAYDVVNNPDIARLLQDKYVFLGSTTEISSDFYQIPKYNYLPGVTIQAIVFNQILQLQFPQPYNIPLLFNIFCFILLISLLSLKRLGKYANIFWIAGVGLLLILLVLPPFSQVVPISVIIASIASLLLGFLMISLLKISYDRFHLRTVLDGHFSPAVMNQLLAQPDGINLGGEKSDVTVLFTDLRGFTKFSEQIEPEELGNILNHVLGAQADIVINNGGVIDKYIGDAVMGFWGAPIPDSDHPFNALLAACLIVQEFAKLTALKGYSFDIGAGLYSGPAIVGNFGSSQRFNYTVIGDTVNTASRIESLTKTYKSKVLIGGQLLERLSEKQKVLFEFELQDTVQPRGKNQSIEIYSVNAFLSDSGWYTFDKLQ